jgi:hypothetical protein
MVAGARMSALIQVIVTVVGLVAGGCPTINGSGRS